MPKLPQHIEERFDKELNWKDCGNFKSEDYTISRPCVICGVDTRFCVNCSTDHHLGNRDVAIKSFIATILEEERKKLLDKIDNAKTYSVCNGGEYEWHCPLCHHTGSNSTHVCTGDSKLPCDKTCGEWFNKNLIK